MILDRFKVTGKVAIVTGAGRGIGQGSALALAEMGANVVCAARTREQIEETADKASTFGVKALAVPCDVSEHAQLENVVAEAMKQFGRIDILVNNAGGSMPKAALGTSEEMFNAAFQFNVTTAFAMTRLVVPHMQASGGGAIVNISSAAGRLIAPGFAAYGTAKCALSFLTKLLGCEFAPTVRVNAIAVGSTLTSALAPFLSPEMRGQMEAMTPMKRLGEVEDIALMVLYLASPASSWVTGKIFEIDGGTESTNWPFAPF
ncbi:MAG: short-chain dehydrogenase [Deltaproteobacteria bacterium]|jgi:7-alpha-hydroxysteroid dehydrogenase|nr:short-chain dehydrogenase [Deltaproteobacteria bacterium]